MAKRYRYAFAKKKEAAKGKLSVGLAAASFVLFLTAVFTSFSLPLEYGFLVGGISLFAMLLSVYGFMMGLSSFSQQDCMHRTSILGSITNGVIMVGWLGFYLAGV